MSRHKIDTLTFEAMELEVRGITARKKPEFDKKAVPRADFKMKTLVNEVYQKERGDAEDDEKYILPSNLTVEQHIFSLVFCDQQRPIKVIDHAFRQYEPSLGYWATLGDEELEQRVLEVAERACVRGKGENPRGRSLGTAANVDKVMKFAGKKLFLKTTDGHNKHLIAFKNGTVCTKTGQLRKHDPNYHITACLPYDYQPGTPCPEPMARYIASSFGPNMTEYVRAAIGLILDLTAPDRFVHVIGPSGSGKGVFVRLTMKLFGSESVGSPNNFQIFANPDQVHQYLSGKRYLAIDDIVGFIGEEIGRFYTAVERTAMNARCLFKPKGYTQQFDIRYTVASTGQLPTKYSNSKGWERRVFPLPTTRRQEEDDRLEADLEGCIADIVSWALSQDKAERNKILRHPERYCEGAAEYFREAATSSSSAWAFVEECLVPEVPDTTDTPSSQTVDESDLYQAYKSYCAATGKKPMALDSLKHELKQALPINFIDRKGGGQFSGRRRFVYMGLRRNVFTKQDESLPGFDCDLTQLGQGGIQEFKEWAKTYGHLYPYAPSDLQTVTQGELTAADSPPPTPTATDTPIDSTESDPMSGNSNSEPLHGGELTALTASTALKPDQNEKTKVTGGVFENSVLNEGNRVSGLSSLSTNGQPPPTVTHPDLSPDRHLPPGIPEIATAVDEPWMYDNDE